MVGASDGPLNEALLDVTDGRGVNYVLDTTAVPAVLTAAAQALSIRGTLALVGASAPGTVAPFEIGLSLVKGWTFKTIIQGSSIPQQFIPRLVTLWEQGRFPFDKMIRAYKLDEINLAFSESASGVTVKPVVVYSPGTRATGRLRPSSPCDLAVASRGSPAEVAVDTRQAVPTQPPHANAVKCFFLTEGRHDVIRDLVVQRCRGPCRDGVVVTLHETAAAGRG